MAKLKCEIELELKDKDGKVLEKRRFPSHTYVLNFFLLLDVELSGRDMTLTDLNGSSKNTILGLSNSSYNFGITSGYGGSTSGIVIGTSDFPYSPTQYKLQSIISHGSGSGQMLYGVESIDAPQQVTGGYRVVISRVFTNVSGASITVKEIGIYTYAHNVGNIMMVRDVITPVTVANGQSLTVRYIISLTSS